MTTQNPQRPELDDLQLMNAAALAALLDVSTRTIWRMLSSGQLITPHTRIGRQPRWRVNEVRRWIDSGCPRPAQRQQ